MTPPFRLFAAGIATAALAGCGGAEGRGDAADRCGDRSDASAPRAFVVVRTPRSGDRVTSGFGVAGCSSTFEANVSWRLRAADGRELARGFTQGGAIDPGPFAFTVSYALAAGQRGQLEVYAPRVTTEGYPPPTTSVPLLLDP